MKAGCLIPEDISETAIIRFVSYADIDPWVDDINK